MRARPMFAISLAISALAVCANARMTLAQDAEARPSIVLPPLPDVDPPVQPAPAAVAAPSGAVEAQPAAPTPVADAVSDDAVRAALAELADIAKRDAAIRGPQAPLTKQRDAVAAFYAKRDFAPLWRAAGAWTPAARDALAQLDRAPEDGLDLRATPLPALATDDAKAIAAADFALSAAVANYAWQASGGRVDPATIARLIDERPIVVDAATALADVSAAADAGAALRGFNPPQPGYQALRQLLAELRRDPAASTDLVGVEQPAAPARKPAPPPRAPSAVEMEDEILANMERWRWEPRAQTTDQIEVNIPDYTVKVTLAGAVALRSRVIVGQPTKQTPVFSNQMKFIEVNPYWNVPQSIIKNEMLPKLARDPNYFQRMGYEVTTSHGQMVVRQPPGERNALGRIKFMFPNDHAVYLHDTPSRGLFNASRRALSHGCVRVEDPFRFAVIVLGKDSGWDEARVKKLIGGKNQAIQLPRHIDIHIEYFTAFVDDDGKLRLRDDVYGYSRKVRAALGLAA